MKIKMIDLFVKMANGEEIPKKIKYSNKIWEYTTTVKGKGYQYYSILHGDWKTLQNQVYLEECLNDEVEIIEETNKIEKITVREKTLGFPNGDWTARNMDKAFAIKINELIDEINNLKEND